MFESESQRKDGVIGQLRAEMEHLRAEVHSHSAGGGAGGDAELAAKVQQLDSDMNMKQLEINALKEQVGIMLASICYFCASMSHHLENKRRQFGFCCHMLSGNC